MQEQYIYKLKNINLKERIKNFPPDFNFNIDFAYLLIHFIIEKMSQRIIKRDKDISLQYVKLSSKILQSYNRDYRNHIRYLCENLVGIGNILERRNYSKNNCFSYRFRPFYRFQQLETYKITDKLLLKKISLNRLKKQFIDVEKKYPFLLDYFNKSRLKIQFYDALNKNSDKLEEEGNYTKYHCYPKV